MARSQLIWARLRSLAVWTGLVHWMSSPEFGTADFIRAQIDASPLSYRSSCLSEMTKKGTKGDNTDRNRVTWIGCGFSDCIYDMNECIWRSQLLETAKHPSPRHRYQSHCVHRCREDSPAPPEGATAYDYGFVIELVSDINLERGTHSISKN